MTREKAHELRKIIVKATQSLDGKDASMVPELFDKLKYDGAVILAGTKIQWHGRVMKAANNCWNREDNNPDNVPTLWEELLYRDGVRIIPENITVGTAFQKDEQGWYNGKIYTSAMDNNVHTPKDYPQGWIENAENGNA